MKLKEKREMVQQFLKGKSCMDIAADINPSRGLWTGPLARDIEQILRDYLNGKFRLQPKKAEGRIE